MDCSFHSTETWNGSYNRPSNIHMQAETMETAGKAQCLKIILVLFLPFVDLMLEFAQY